LHLKKDDLGCIIDALGLLRSDGDEVQAEHAQTLHVILSHVSKDRNHLNVEFGRWEDDNAPQAAPAPASTQV
jgi:hypothetical protein